LAFREAGQNFLSPREAREEKRKGRKEEGRSCDYPIGRVLRAFARENMSVRERSPISRITRERSANPLKKCHLEAPI